MLQARTLKTFSLAFSYFILKYHHFKYQIGVYVLQKITRNEATVSTILTLEIGETSCSSALVFRGVEP